MKSEVDETVQKISNMIEASIHEDVVSMEKVDISINKICELIPERVIIVDEDVVRSVEVKDVV